MKYRLLSAGTAFSFLALLSPTRAQTTSGLSDTRAVLFSVEKKDGEAAPVAVEPVRKVAGVKPTELKPVRFHKIQFLALSAGVYGAAFADMHQTLHVRNYWWWTETDPLARPFVRLPASAYYATGFALATGVNWLGWEMGHSRRWHKLAAIPQLMSIGGNTYGYRSNCYSGY